MRYIGSKTRILDFISDTVQQTYGSVDNAVVADLFAGTCAVSEMYKLQYRTEGIMDYKELCNELEAYGDVQNFYKPYRRYKSNGGGSGETEVKEIIVYVKKE